MDTTKKNENDLIRDNKHVHLKNCQECFITFSRQGYFSATDYNYAAVMFNEILVATMSGKKCQKEGRQYFRTDDLVGCDGSNSKEVGMNLTFIAGGNQLQGRVLSKLYAGLHCILEIGATKQRSGFEVNINIDDVNVDKLRIVFIGRLKRHILNF